MEQLEESKNIPLPHEDEMVKWLRTEGSHLMILNDLPDGEDDKANKIAAALHKSLSEISDELERLSGEIGVRITVKTILSVTQGGITNV